MSTHLFLVSNSFPFYNGEQFLETEVEYYCSYRNLKVTVLPLSRGNGETRRLPECISLDQSCIIDPDINNIQRSFYLLRSMKNGFFYKEFVTEVLQHSKKIRYFISAMIRYQKYYDLFDSFIKKNEEENEMIFYTYWHNEASYALQSLKRKYRFSLVSRIHGTDLYEEIRPQKYMPLKRHFTKEIDKIYTITQSAKTYMYEHYGFEADVLEVSRLGVNDLHIKTKVSESNFFHIVSCSHLVEVKQVEKIILSIEALGKLMPQVSFKWTHIGSGPLHEYLDDLSTKRLLSLENVENEFLGDLKNTQVYDFYKNTAIDVFLNVSKSEGVPVSIMEAMSCAIPIIAPDIGGVSDMLITGYNGILLDKNPSIEDIVTSLKDIEYFKNETIRANAYAMFLKKYKAENNYNDFIKKIILLNQGK